jgi:ketosteroid isomerase-like protein
LGGVSAREVVERLNETINAHDLAAGRALYAEDARLVPASGVAFDLDGLDNMMRASLAALPDLAMTVLRWVEAGDTVVTEEVMNATHLSGKPVQLPMVHITRVVDGLIVERVAYHDTAGILRQLTD